VNAFFDKHYAAGLAVVTEAHDGQFRADQKTPYVVHPVEVARRVRARFDAMPYPEVKRLAKEYAFDDTVEFVLMAVLAALGHDVKEDKPKFPLVERWIAAGIPEKIAKMADAVVTTLSNVGGDYLDYILYLKLHGQFVSLLIKEEDMNVNWVDIDGIPSKGRRKSMRTKYLLAHYILFGRKPYEAERLPNLDR
jgi:hypothetical protein